MVPLAGIEPALLAELDFESSASTSSATGAFRKSWPKGTGGLRSRRTIAGNRGRSTRADVIFRCSTTRVLTATRFVIVGDKRVTSETSAIPQVSRSSANPVLSAALAILVIAAATIAGAWFIQLVLDIQPCPLCLHQRYAYYTIIPLSALLAVGAARSGPRGVLVFGLSLIALAALANAVFGAYHAGVEWGFWKGPTTCTGPLVNLGNAGSLFEQLDKVKVIPCDVVQWRFLGISLAGYNALISLLMAAVAGWGIAKQSKRWPST